MAIDRSLVATEISDDLSAYAKAVCVLGRVSAFRVALMQQGGPLRGGDGIAIVGSDKYTDITLEAISKFTLHELDEGELGPWIQGQIQKQVNGGE